MKSLLLLGLLLGGGFWSNAQAQRCLSYEPAVVTLEGKVSRKTFAGPPNFESIKKGDEPETYWVLRLHKSICVNSGTEGSTGPAGPSDEESEKGVSIVQLILSKDQYARYKDLVGRQVIVTGKLLHAISGHHHTSVLIEVTEIKST